MPIWSQRLHGMEIDTQTGYLWQVCGFQILTFRDMLVIRLAFSSMTLSPGKSLSGGVCAGLLRHARCGNSQRTILRRGRRRASRLVNIGSRISASGLASA